MFQQLWCSWQQTVQVIKHSIAYTEQHSSPARSKRGLFMIDTVYFENRTQSVILSTLKHYPKTLAVKTIGHNYSDSNVTHRINTDNNYSEIGITKI